MKGVLESDTDPLVLHEWNGDPMADESWTSRRHTPSVATAGSLPDYYEVLQVSPNADVEIIQAAHKRLLEKWLSDRRPGDPSAFERITLLDEASAVLSKPQKRQEYDSRRRQSVTSGGDQIDSALAGSRTPTRTSSPTIADRECPVSTEASQEVDVPPTKANTNNNDKTNAREQKEGDESTTTAEPVVKTQGDGLGLWTCVWLAVGTTVIVLTLVNGTEGQIGKMIASLICFSVFAAVSEFTREKKQESPPTPATPDAFLRDPILTPPVRDGHHTEAHRNEAPTQGSATDTTNDARMLNVPAATPENPSAIVQTPANQGSTESVVNWLGAFVGVVLFVAVVVGIAVFATTKAPTWTQEEKENATHFFVSQQTVDQAFATVRPVLDMSKPLGGLAHSDVQRVVNFLKLALSEAKSVTDQVLAKAHPQLPQMYREKYIRSLELAIVGHETGVSKPDAVALRNQWNDWWAANKDNVRFPKDVRK